MDPHEVVPRSTLGKFAGISTNNPLGTMHFPVHLILELCRYVDLLVPFWLRRSLYRFPIADYVGCCDWSN
jgi:hypothetical protein